MKFEIKDGERCKSMEPVVKRLSAGEVFPPMPSNPPPPPDLRFIDKLSREACQTVYEKLQARGRQLRAEDPLVYGIKRIYKGVVRYHTRVKGLGWRQLMATDLRHSNLWLTSLRENAEVNCTEMANVSSLKATWEVYELPKAEAVKLPCYECHYSKFKEMTG